MNIKEIIALGFSLIMLGGTIFYVLKVTRMGEKK
jgi:hypothetical protein